MPEEVLRTNLMWTQALIDEIGDDPDLINRIIANHHRRCFGPESEAAAMETVEQIGVERLVEIGTALAEAMSASKSDADGGGGGIRRLFQLNPHGGAENPHTGDPDVGDHCIQCGRRRLPGDEESWQEFADIRPVRSVPLTEAVLRRALKDATVEELRYHLERMERFEKVAPPGDEAAKLNSEIGWFRKLIAEREQSEDGDA
jgi:hypothetical protein